MGTLTIRIPDDKHARLKTLANSKGVSLNKLFEEFSTQAIAESDAYTRFQAYSAQGDPKQGLDIIDKVDKHFSKSKKS